MGLVTYQKVLNILAWIRSQWMRLLKWSSACAHPVGRGTHTPSMAFLMRENSHRSFINTTQDSKSAASSSTRLLSKSSHDGIPWHSDGHILCNLQRHVVMATVERSVRVPSRLRHDSVIGRSIDRQHFHRADPRCAILSGVSRGFRHNLRRQRGVT